MSHLPPVTSPEGTLLPDRTVGELVAERPGLSRVFQSHKIDFCCQGNRTLREACLHKNIPLDSVVEQIEEEQSEALPTDFNPAFLSPPELIEYIVETHHAFLRRELPRLQTMAQRVALVHGPSTPSLIEVFDVFSGLAQELDSHIQKEEQILFPLVVAMSRGESPPVLLDGPISCMLHEHDDAGVALKRLYDLTYGYEPPAWACNTYRALFSGLKDLEEDLHRHIHLENSVLFPAAEEMASRLG